MFIDKKSLNFKNVYEITKTEKTILKNPVSHLYFE